MFGIGLTELIVILVVALIFIGPEKLPGIARTLGRAFNEFRRAGDELKKSIAGIEPEEGKRPRKAGAGPDPAGQAPSATAAAAPAASSAAGKAPAPTEAPQKENTEKA
ncbi:MAG TPA: twin-arginine translocase subunit TatB [Deltaproteobacteria bacterium]|nr:twin-arginine translocase subunit TatB [Deltaproteobacteria bacterium]